MARKKAKTENRHVIDIEEAQKERRRKREQAITDKKKKSRKDKKESSADTVLRVSSDARKKKRKKASRTKKFLIVVMILVVLIFSGGAIAQVVSLNMELRDAKAEQERRLEEKEMLENDLERINDPEYIEEQARKRLRMIRQGEILYVFPDEENENSE